MLFVCWYELLIFIEFIIFILNIYLNAYFGNLDMCPGSDVSSGSVHRQSYVEEFPDGIPELFAALTAEPDSLKRWKPVTVQIPTGDLSLRKYYS